MASNRSLQWMGLQWNHVRPRSGLPTTERQSSKDLCSLAGASKAALRVRSQEATVVDG